jgi:hypothetical protein
MKLNMQPNAGRRRLLLTAVITVGTFITGLGAATAQPPRTGNAGYTYTMVGQYDGPVSRSVVQQSPGRRYYRASQSRTQLPLANILSRDALNTRAAWQQRLADDAAGLHTMRKTLKADRNGLLFNPDALPWDPPTQRITGTSEPGVPPRGTVIGTP